jgi:hypothetical protein
MGTALRQRDEVIKCERLFAHSPLADVADPSVTSIDLEGVHAVRGVASKPCPALVSVGLDLLGVALLPRSDVFLALLLVSFIEAAIDFATAVAVLFGPAAISGSPRLGVPAPPLSVFFSGLFWVSPVPLS